MKKYLNINIEDYDIHINFPGGIPIDGPSAGIAIMSAVYSAITNRPISDKIAMTGEISIKGKVKPIGGVVAKVQAAKEAGVEKVIIPKDNWRELFTSIGIDVIPVDNMIQVIDEVFNLADKDKNIENSEDGVNSIIVASGM